MEQSLLVELISILKPEEKDQILPFAASQFYRRDKIKAQVLAVLKLCLTHDWSAPQQRLEKRSVFSIVFPNQDFVDGKLEKLMVEAHKVVRSFLLTQHYLREDNEFQQTLDFAEIARLRGLETRHQQYMNKLKKMQEEFPFKSNFHFHRQFQLETAVHYVECLNNQQKGDLNIPQVLLATETFYQLRRIALLSRYLLQQRIAKLDTPDYIQEHLAAAAVPLVCMDASPQLKINEMIFQVLKKQMPETTDVIQLFNLIKYHEPELDKECLQEFYSYLRNFSILISSLDPENLEIIRTLYELYIDNLNRGYLHYEGKISPSRFQSITLNALKIREFEWASDFIEKNKYDIYGDNETQDIYRLTKARYLFATNQFAECLEYIPPTSHLVDHMLVGKRIELKALFELESDLFTYKLDAFKMFLSRTSPKILSDSMRKIYVDFANLLTQIHACPPGDHPRAGRILKKVTEKKQSAEWRWLVEKASALQHK